MWTKRGKARLILIFNTNTNCENMAYRSVRSEKCSARGVRKVTTGITGLWQPGVHSDVAFWSFDVNRIVHPPIKTWAGFRPISLSLSLYIYIYIYIYILYIYIYINIFCVHTPAQAPVSEPGKIEFFTKTVFLIIHVEIWEFYVWPGAAHEPYGTFLSSFRRIRSYQTSQSPRFHIS